MENFKTLRPSPTALLNPRCDPIFKAIFTQGTKESDFALKELISALLGQKVTELTLQPNEPPVETVTNMQMSFDVSVKFDTGELAEIEMQGRNQDYDYAVRSEIQVARLLNVSAKRGSNWNTPKVYQISILNFEFDNNDKSALSWYTMEKENGKHLGDRLNVIFLDLIKIKRKLGTSPEELSKVEKWGMYFACADNEKHRDYIEQIIKSEEGLMAADFVVKRMSADEANWFKQNSYLMGQWDYNHGLERAEERGLARGERNAKLEDAKNLLAFGDSAEKVSAVTGLSVDEILSLAVKN